ncbi:hypothetical protein [Nonomuraea gerenzanensis]|uniref:hypothetical protein n=1 Tax=Nonomuraea gerenzanensis TaxID=93944 RepID=UPI001CD99C69|nr:hypothetical protein [Nonomuraea gerenzanensis]UBU18440.1 hypothetical protein LCN96_26485 [Nonomuraea gerenzanensis]
MDDDQLLRHPDLLAMSARYWRDQARDRRRRLNETRRETAALIGAMRALRDRMCELEEQIGRAQARADHLVLDDPADRPGGPRVAEGPEPV